MKMTTCAAVLALALLGAPCQAITSSPAGSVQANLKQGVIEQLGSVLRISGKSYAFSSAAVVRDHKGAPSSAARLAVGQTVAFSIVEEGRQARIKDLWIIQ
ncbi:MAG: hypothetical protein V4484_01540 [Pseudomonadota bacterium]